jgi:hypothetical protein
MRTNFLIEIRDDNHLSPEKRFITVYANDEDEARNMGGVAAESMCEDYHKAPTFYVDQVIPLE